MAIDTLGNEGNPLPQGSTADEIRPEGMADREPAPGADAQSPADEPTISSVAPVSSVSSSGDAPSPSACSLTCPVCGATYSRLPGYRCPRCGHAFETCASCQGCGGKSGPRAGSVSRILEWLKAP